MNQVKRQWIILTLVPQARGQAKSTEEIHRILVEQTREAVGKRTVERDLQALSEDFDIHYRAEGKTYYWSWQDVPRMWLPGLTAEQALAFYMIEQNLKSLLPEATLQSLTPFFRAAESKLDAAPARVRSWKKKFRLIDSTQMLNPASMSPGVARAIREALLDDRALRVTYRDRSGKQTFPATILPLALTQRGVVLYLIYKNLDDGSQTYIQMHRIQSAAPSLLARPPLAAFDIDAYIKSGQLGFGRTYPIKVGSTLELVAIFSQKTAERLAETSLGEQQTLHPCDDGRVTLKTRVKFSGHLLWWLLSYADNVEVLEPPELRELIAETLKHAAAQYEERGGSTSGSTSLTE
ncbi:MAG: hypothetical protein AW10_00966 [Candidatus Accumulibacter appositus]|uniref:Uncharacterized protein n=1 Tax=Candidatus Accumulibacter appositus TaxID=1454003 RepID=A0A011PY32_9PROT|nr:WYL domain-containing protein [Accumulibacter sp.]EXI81780.1 MAG: hypothetical protein AW10_00966 [Candidatus Accumulibacter appositus]HRF04155.1 WYL domain-containing protein [Accumulibacter sp.]